MTLFAKQRDRHKEQRLLLSVPGQLLATPQTAARQASLSLTTISWSLPKFMSTEYQEGKGMVAGTDRLGRAHTYY